MRKPKATVKTLRAELKALQAVLDKRTETFRAFVFAVKTAGRTLFTIAPANDKGMINGMTIPELIMLVNLKENEGEYITLRTTSNKQDLVVIAQKNLPSTPWELL
jgi:hypothetical protein